MISLDKTLDTIFKQMAKTELFVPVRNISSKYITISFPRNNTTSENIAVKIFTSFKDNYSSFRNHRKKKLLMSFLKINTQEFSKGLLYF